VKKVFVNAKTPIKWWFAAKGPALASEMKKNY